MMDFVFGLAGWFTSASAAALLLLAQRSVMPRSRMAGKCLMTAGGIVLVAQVVGWLSIGALVPVLEVVAVAAAAWALLCLMDDLYAVKTKLPLGVEAQRSVKPTGSTPGWVLLGALSLVGMYYAGLLYASPVLRLAYIAAVVAVVLCGGWLQRREPGVIWLLERRPEQVVWIYPSQLTVVRRLNGVPTGRQIFWSTTLGLESGARLSLPVFDEHAAKARSMEIAEFCPRASVGHSNEIESTFRKAPRQLRRS